MENKNLLLAVLLSAAVLFGWQYFVAGPQMKAEQQKQAYLAKQKGAETKPEAIAAKAQQIANVIPRGQALKATGGRVVISTPTVDGSLSLTGARFDDLQLRRYHETVDPKSPEIVLLSPKSTAYPYYAIYGWVAATGDHVKLPDDNTPWTLQSGKVLSPDHPVTLRWDNGEGLVFTRTIAVDDQYMFTVSDSVANTGGKTHTLFPYAYVARQGVPPETQHYWSLHEGYVGVADGSLKDAKYDDFKKDEPPQTFHSNGGWLGITDKYWMAAVVPPQNEAMDASFSASPYRDTKAYQADYRLGAHTVNPGQTIAVTQRLFAGAKVVSVIQDYEKNLGIAKFDYAIDWGWYSFFTRPMFWILDKSYAFLGNFGLAILLLTVLIRAALFPLANAGFKQMTRMKKLQPEMERIKERHGDDRVAQQQEMMALYQREKVNPVSGCLPMLIQIPIMFSLYKVFLVTIEMYHTPFYGWIKDLSAPDPTSLINLFGLLPFNPHAILPSFLSFLSIGIWPVLLGITQWVQTKMNPAPADPVQAQMFGYMPIIFTFMFASLPSGLVIYYTWSNFLTLIQQYVMMRRHGVEIHLFNNLKLPWATKPKPAE
ncbi:MAG TPA: membrane protein insertase YidC [Rhizomicrobium sp.]|nr:membrane protein insertase YidC [Rhizomicrobium sp.]